MTGLNLLSTNKNSALFRPGFAPSDFGDVVSSAYTNIRENYNFDSEIRLIGDPINKRDALIKERFGKDVSELTGTNKKYTNPTAEGRIAQLKEDHDLIDQQIMIGRKENPSQWDGIKTTSELREEGKKVAQDAMKASEDTSSRSQSQFTNISGQLIGGIGGTFTDPLTVATLPFGAGETKVVGTGTFAVAKAITMTAVKEGAIQAAIQAASIPQVAHWQNAVGHKYGLSEGAMDVGLGFLGGTAMRGIGDALIPAIRGTYRGANHISAYAIDTIAEKAPYISQNVKDALKYMSRTAYVDEAAPIEIKTHSDLNAHREMAQQSVDDINQYKRPLSNINNSEAIIKLKEKPEFKTAVENNQNEIIAFHGTKEKNVGQDFVFDYSKIGKNGRAEGVGFYFTTDKKVAQGYGKDGSLITAKLDIKNPLKFDAPGFSKAQLKKIVKEIVNQEKKSGTKPDEGFLTNYGDVNTDGIDKVINDAVQNLDTGEKAIDQIGGIYGSGVKAEILNRSVNKATGYDGMVSKGFSNEGKAGGDIYVAFFPDQVKIINENSNKLFDDNAYRLSEYREAPITPPSEIKASERLSANQSRFASFVKENPDMLVTTEDGSAIRLSDYAEIIKEDEKIIEALTTCMVA